MLDKTRSVPPIDLVNEVQRSNPTRGDGKRVRREPDKSPIALTSDQALQIEALGLEVDPFVDRRQAGIMIEQARAQMGLETRNKEVKKRVQELTARGLKLRSPIPKRLFFPGHDGFWLYNGVDDHGVIQFLSFKKETGVDPETRADATMYLPRPITLKRKLSILSPVLEDFAPHEYEKEYRQWRAELEESL